MGTLYKGKLVCRDPVPKRFFSELMSHKIKNYLVPEQKRRSRSLVQNENRRKRKMLDSFGRHLVIIDAQLP